MIKIFEQTERLHRLINLGAPEDDIWDEFHECCFRLFGSTIWDLQEEAFSNLDHRVSQMYDNALVAVCAELGYDILIRPNHLIRMSDEFAILILASGNGLLPATEEERIARRLETEAREYQRKKNDGTLAG